MTSRALLLAVVLVAVACADEDQERWESEKPIWDRARADFAAGTLTGSAPERLPSVFREKEELSAFVLAGGIEARFDAGAPPLAAFLWHRGRNEVWIVHDPSGGLATLDQLARMDGVPDVRLRPDLQRVARMLGRPLFRAEDRGGGYYWTVVE